MIEDAPLGDGPLTVDGDPHEAVDVEMETPGQAPVLKIEEDPVLEAPAHI